MKPRPIDILRKANAREPLRVELELPGLKCWLYAPNRHQITDIKEKLYRIAYAEACDIGLAGKPVNQAEYEAVKNVTAFANADAPRDAAEQYAQLQSVTQIIYNLLPALVRDDSGAELFPTLEEKRFFLAEVRESIQLESYLLDKWRELFAARDEVTAEAKNEQTSG